MSEPTFTEDPWRWTHSSLRDTCRDGVEREEEGGGTLVGANGDRIIETDSGFYPPYGPDRALIAAAPKLYKALDKLVDAIESGAVEGYAMCKYLKVPEIKAAVEALAEARGER